MMNFTKTLQQQRQHHVVTRPGRGFSYAMCLVFALLLSACTGSQHGDLDAFVKSVKAKPKGRIPPLPEVKSYETFVYQAHELRDPFTEYIEVDTARAADSPDGPDLNRKREALEQFPLDTLAFVGHLEKGGNRWGLISAPDNAVYRVQSGNYIGKNYGEILTVTETTIKLKEIIPDGTGGWVEREASLALSE